MAMVTVAQARRGADVLIGLIREADKQYAGHDQLNADDVNFRKGEAGYFHVCIDVKKDGVRHVVKSQSLAIDSDHTDMRTAAGVILLNAICKGRNGDVTDARTDKAVSGLCEMTVLFALGLVEKSNEKAHPHAA